MLSKIVSIDPDVKALLAQATVAPGQVKKRQVFVLTMPLTSDRRAYVKANEVLESLGGKWTRGIGHVFTDDPCDALENILKS